MVKMKGFPYGAAAATGMGQDKDSALADFLYGEESLPGEPPSLDELAPEAVFMSEAAPQTPVADINDESDVSTINLQNFLYGPEGGAGIISTDPFAPNPAAPPIRRTADGTPLHLVGDMTKENVDKWTDISLHGSINEKMDALKNSEEFGAPPALEYAMSEALARDFIKKHGIDRPLSAYAGFADTEGELRAWSGGTDVMEKGTTKTPPLAAFSELEPISTSLQKKEAVPGTDLLSIAAERGVPDRLVRMIKTSIATAQDASARPVFGDPTRYESWAARNTSTLTMVLLAKYGIGAGFVASAAGDIGNAIQGLPPAPLGEPQDITYRLDKSTHVDLPTAQAMFNNIEKSPAAITEAFSRAALIALRHDKPVADVIKEILNPNTTGMSFRAYLQGLSGGPGSLGIKESPFSTPWSPSSDPIPDPFALVSGLTNIITDIAGDERPELDLIDDKVTSDTDAAVRELASQGVFGEKYADETGQNIIASITAQSVADTLVRSYGGPSLSEQYASNLAHGLGPGTVHAVQETFGFLSDDPELVARSKKKWEDDTVMAAFDFGMVSFLAGAGGMKAINFARDPVGARAFGEFAWSNPLKSSQISAEAAAAEAASQTGARVAAMESMNLYVDALQDRMPGVQRVTGSQAPPVGQGVRGWPLSEGRPRIKNITTDDVMSGTERPAHVPRAIGETATWTPEDWAGMTRKSRDITVSALRKAFDEGRYTYGRDGGILPAEGILDPYQNRTVSPLLREAEVSRRLAKELVDADSAMAHLLNEHSILTVEAEAAVLREAAKLDLVNPERSGLPSQSARSRAAELSPAEVEHAIAVRKMVGERLSELPTEELVRIARRRGVNTNALRQMATGQVLRDLLVQELEIHRMLPLAEWNTSALIAEVRLAGRLDGSGKPREWLLSEVRKIHDESGSMRRVDYDNAVASAKEIADFPELTRRNIGDVVDTVSQRLEEVAGSGPAKRQAAQALDLLETPEGIRGPSSATPIPKDLVSLGELSAIERMRILNVYRSTVSPSQRGAALAERGVVDPAIYSEIGLGASEIVHSVFRGREVQAMRQMGGAGGEGAASILSPKGRLLAHEEQMALQQNMTLDQWRANRALESRAMSLAESGVDSVVLYEELGIPYNMAVKYAERGSRAIPRVVVAPKSPGTMVEALGVEGDLGARLMEVFGRPDEAGTSWEAAGVVARKLLLGERGAAIVSGKLPPAPGAAPLSSPLSKGAWALAETLQRPFAVFNIPAAVQDYFGSFVARNGAGKVAMKEGWLSFFEAVTSGSSKFGELYYHTELYRRTQTLHLDKISPLLKDLQGKPGAKITPKPDEVREVLEHVFEAEKAKRYGNDFYSDGEISMTVAEANRIADVAVRMAEYEFKTPDGNVVLFGELFTKKGLFEGQWFPLDALNKMANKGGSNPRRVWSSVSDWQWFPKKDLADMPAYARTMFYVANKYARPVNKVVFEQSMQMALHPDTMMLSVVPGKGDKGMRAVGSRKIDIMRKDAFEKSANYLSDYYDGRAVFTQLTDTLKTLSEGRSVAEVQASVVAIDKLLGRVMPKKVTGEFSKEQSIKLTKAKKQVEKTTTAYKNAAKENVAAFEKGELAPHQNLADLKQRSAAAVKKLQELKMEIGAPGEFRASELYEYYNKNKGLLHNFPGGELPAAIDRYYRGRVWGDMPYSQKIEMGLFDFRESVMKTVSGQGHNLAFQKYMTWTRENGMLLTKAERNALPKGSDLKDQYVTATIKDSPVYGDLGGDFYIHRHAKLQLERLNDAFIASQTSLSRMHSTWKLGIVGSIDTVMRNIWSNIFMMGHIADVPYKASYLPRAHQDLMAFIRTGKETPLLRQARAEGYGKATAANLELLDADAWVNYQFNMLKPYMEIQKGLGDTVKGTPFQKTVESLFEVIPVKGKRSETIEFVEQVNLSAMKRPLAMEKAHGAPSISSRVSGAFRRGKEKLAKGYGYIDDLNKYSYIIQLVEEHGMPVREAVRRADTVFMDYADMAPILDSFRNPAYEMRTLGSGKPLVGERHTRTRAALGALTFGTSFAAPFIAFSTKAVAKMFEFATIRPQTAFVFAHLFEAHNYAVSQMLDMPVEELKAQMRLRSRIPEPIAIATENPYARSPMDVARVGPASIGMTPMSFLGALPEDLQRQSREKVIIPGMEDMPGVPGPDSGYQIGNVLSAMTSFAFGRGDGAYQAFKALTDGGGQYTRYDESNPWGKAVNDSEGALSRLGNAMFWTATPRAISLGLEGYMAMTDTEMFGRKPRTDVNYWTNLAGGATDALDQRRETFMAQKTLEGKMDALTDFVVGVSRRNQMNPGSVDMDEIDAANSITQNLLIPWHYGVDGSVPWKKLSKEEGAGALLRTMEQYAPALIGLMRSRSLTGDIDPELMKSIKRAIIEQGLTETEAYKTFK
tara:strand:+ start:3882 stop:11093 length:7212 start_codon:yes stop_codon:yes gene_type:complete